ncbi:hypothetical protein DXV76_07875 [Rhodobacteraceae bacterium CCMM004]|nr:hypothetical protein DXV76_07875 [Rhodobacteraceae bacterium CCMM004]
MTAADAPSADDRSLDRALCAAHARADAGALIRLYDAAAQRRLADGRLDAACFYLTHAYVHALEAGSDQASAFRARLRDHGRED